jgi:hypothetical protein
MRSGGFRITNFQFTTNVKNKHKALILQASPPEAKTVLAKVHSIWL